MKEIPNSVLPSALIFPLSEVKQSRPALWRHYMTILWHWGLLDKEDVDAVFRVADMPPIEGNGFPRNYMDCYSLINILKWQLAEWDDEHPESPQRGESDWHQLN
jgi:hypothetical protein